MRIGFRGELVDEKRIRAGFVGCGSHSFRNIYPTFQFAPVKLVATCDRHLDKARAFAEVFGAEAAYGDVDLMLQHDDLDAVFVVTGYDDQGRPQYPRLARQCLAAGKHVWIEKPPAATTSEIEQLQAEEFSLRNKALKPGANPLEGISGDLFDISVEIDLGKATEVGLRLHRNTIKYYTSDHMITCLDAAAPLAPVNNTIKLRVLVDRTTIELFGNDGRVSLSSCFLPRKTETDLELFARGGRARIISLDVYKLRSAWFPAKE